VGGELPDDKGIRQSRSGLDAQSRRNLTEKAAKLQAQFGLTEGGYSGIL
jgi:hypothetical protein